MALSLIPLITPLIGASLAASIYDGASCLYVGTGQKIDDNGKFHLSTQARLGLDCKEVKFTRAGEDFVRSSLKLHADTEKPKGPPITLRPTPHYQTAPRPSPSPRKKILGLPG